MDNLEYLKKQTQILINLYNAKRYEEVILKDLQRHPAKPIIIL